MPEMDVVEKRLADLGVNVWDIKEQDAYWRCVTMLDRCENRISNLIVENEELKDDWAALTKKLAEVSKNGDKCPVQRLRKAARRMSRRLRGVFGLCAAEAKDGGGKSGCADGHAEDRGGEA